MPSLKIISTGRIDQRESAFPQTVQLPSGDILCSFSVGGGQYVHGGTDWSRSTDGGQTWRSVGSGLPSQEVVAFALHTFRPDTFYVEIPGQGVFRTEIPEDPRAAEAPSHGTPLVAYARSKAARAYSELTRELLARIKRPKR